MRIQKRQRVYGLVHGALGFLAAWGLVYWLTPASVLSELTRVKASLWVLMAAHFVEISALGLPGFAVGRVDMTAVVPWMQPLHLVPFFVCILGSVLLADTISSTSRFDYTMINAGYFTVGYALTALVAFALSDVQPGMTVLMVVGVGLFAAAFVGSLLVQGATGGVPFIGIASFGTILVVGVIAIFGGVALLDSVWTLVAIPLLGSAIGGLLTFAARNAPR